MRCKMLYRTPLRSDELMHFGVKGMKWGVRRYQNKDGSLTPLGRKKYGSKENFEYQRELKKAKRAGWLGVAAGTAGAAAGAFGVARAAANGRKETGSKTQEVADTLLDRNNKQGKGKDNMSDLESIAGQTNKVADNSLQTINRASEIQKQRMSQLRDPAIEKEMATMSNKDLQEYITRQNLERQYRSLRQPEITTGLDTSRDILSIVAPLTATAASAVTIGATVHKIRKG